MLDIIMNFDIYLNRDYKSSLTICQYIRID